MGGRLPAVAGSVDAQELALRCMVDYARRAVPVTVA
jgi:hypothetical protein